MNRPLHAATSVALQFCVLLFMGCSSGVLSFQAHDPNFGKPLYESGGEALSIAQWDRYGIPESDIFSEESAYLYRIPLGHLTRRGATLHEIQTGPYAGQLLYFSGKDDGEDWIADAVILDPVTHEIVRQVSFSGEMAMYDAHAVEITQGPNASRIIFVSANGAQETPVKALIIDLSRDEPIAREELLALPNGASLTSLTEVKPSAYHDMGHALLITRAGTMQTEIMRLGLSELLVGNEPWEDAGSISLKRISPKIFDMSKTNPISEIGPLIITPSGQMGDTHPEVLIVRHAGAWQPMNTGSSALGCAGVGSHFLAPQYGSAVGSLVRISGRPTGITVNGSLPSEDACRRSVEVIRFSTPGGGGSWTSERLVFQTGISDPSNQTDGEAKIVEIRSGAWAGDFAISPSLENDEWDPFHSSVEQLRRVRLSFNGAVWTLSETLAPISQQSGPPAAVQVQRKRPQLIALRDGRTALAGGDCYDLDSEKLVPCISKIATHSAYAPIKVEVTGTQAATLEVLDGFQDKFSLGYAASVSRWIVFPKSSVAGTPSNFRLQANYQNEHSNILEYSIRSWPQ